MSGPDVAAAVSQSEVIVAWRGPMERMPCGMGVTVQSVQIVTVSSSFKINILESFL
jgi:hypothetical protein